MAHKTENQGSRSRFNALDAFIILLAVLCAVGIYFRSHIASMIGVDSELDEYQISFKVSKIKSTSGRYLAPGSVVYMDNGITLGTLESSASLPAKAYIGDNSGNTVEVSYPQDTYIDITGKINCKGIQKDDGFYLGGTYSLTPGTVINVHTDIMDFVLTVSDISEIK